MAHHCESLIIHCIDFRLGKKIKAYLEENSLLGDCDIISVAGAIKNLASPDSPADKDFLLGQIGVSVRLHGINKAILLNHTDCGAYGGSSKFNSSEEEREFHIKEMERAKSVILEKYPGLEVEMILGKISPSGEVDLESSKN
jgi:carbonic anhydrase